jgi:hypothetical protein
MSLYQFVFKETPQGMAHHDDPPPAHNHYDRRNLGTEKGHAVFKVERQGDVVEAYIEGYGYYTWTVDARSITGLMAFIQECERHGFVELYYGPIPVLTEEDLSEIKNLLARVKEAFPDQ